ncbi:MAG: hypothetical protein WA823_14960 [Candidatus Acidiferrales bacterium]
MSVNRPTGSSSAKRRASLLLYVSAQFFVLTLLAMALYPGGTHHSPDATRYLFTRNFFSDLGVTQTYSGKPNLLCEVIFIIALGSIGLGLIASSGVWKSIGRTASALGSAAQVFAVLSGICFLGIAATPWNILGRPHMFFVKLGFSLLLGLMASMVLFQRRNGWPGLYVACNRIYILVLAVYVWILFYGPGLKTDSGLVFQVVAQKIIVYASILNLATQAYGLRRKASGSDEIVNAG